MSKPTHTPGPWRYLSTAGGPKKGGWALGSETQRIGNIIFDQKNPDQQADKRLIAAAPDLLAALERLLEHSPFQCDAESCECGENGDGRDERVAFADGTTMTKAGLENWLLELADAGRMPDVLVVDELEKQPTENLSCLNGAMGSGVLAKLNARVGNRRQDVRFLVVGICNDVEALQRTSLGRALWSRFSNKLPCVRPSKELCLHILTEMACRIPGGRPEWAAAALAFGWDELGERDIRELKRHLAARERLVTGEWQRDQLKIRDAKRREDASLHLDADLPGRRLPVNGVARLAI